MAADRLGFRSVSLSERLLLPVGDEWQQAYGLPDWPAYDALESLTWVAAYTERIRLRTDVIVPPIPASGGAGRRLATLDRLSGGRVDAGIALGWMPEEFAATGVRPRGGSPCSRVAALRACWGPDPVVFEGEHYRIPSANIGPKPERGTIALAIGAVSRAATERAARISDGLTLAFRHWDGIREQMRGTATPAGRGRSCCAADRCCPTTNTRRPRRPGPRTT